MSLSERFAKCTFVLSAVSLLKFVRLQMLVCTCILHVLSLARITSYCEVVHLKVKTIQYFTIIILYYYYIIK